MVTRYEAEIARLSEDLKDAYLTVEHEQLQRQQLEEDLRRLFLKNMTAMNMEALNLFEHSHSNVQDVLASSMQASSALSDTRETANNQSFANGLQKMSHNTLPSLGVESTQYADSNETTFVNDRSHHEYEKLVASTFIQSPPIYPPVPSGYQRQDEAEETPRPPLHAARASMPNPDSPHTAALRTSSSNLLSELYRANMATTSRLAHMNIPRKYQ